MHRKTVIRLTDELTIVMPRAIMLPKLVIKAIGKMTMA